MEERRKRFKRRWRLWRKLQMQSQIQLAQLGGVSRSTAQRWEYADNDLLPDVAQLVTICEGLQINPERALGFLMGGGACG